ncbi:MAG: prepilin-type N-terminal cleavage/methylation domain-containing protein, partial [SAR202 cluster bacterium]|nr:prepilin-type N-terminal cleavage/methylation domain-containing protein [SAR202 cluster bacterium]
MCKKDRPKGFSLVELLLVILLIGITSAIAVPNINDWIIDRKVKKEVVELAAYINQKKQEVNQRKYGLIYINSSLKLSKAHEKKN